MPRIFMSDSPEDQAAIQPALTQTMFLKTEGAL